MHLGSTFRFGFVLLLWSAVNGVYASESVSKKTPKTSMNLRKSSEDEELPKVIKVERESPIFASPSVKKKILADVDVGTMLIAREVSAKGSWILVEDEDGNRGWMPVNRTNYKSLVIPTEQVGDDEVEEAVAVEKEEQGKLPPLSSLRVLETLLSNHAIGFSASFLQLQTQDSPLSRERRVGIELGLLREWYFKESLPRTYTIPLIFRMMARSPNSGFFSGPDLGLQFRLKDQSWGGEVGYSFGWGAKVRSGPQTRVRFSAEWGGEWRYLASWGFGWVF